MLYKLNSHKTKQAGFTLVELAIVLVIIGLIISSVLVGQDLVRGAELRASVTQYEQFNAAVGTFRGKYNGLPGDIAGATNFGFTGDGNSDGVLYAASSATGMSGARENNFFWNHLGSSGAGLIPGTYTGSTAIDTDVTGSVAGAMPAAKAGSYWGVFAGRAGAIAEGTNLGPNGSESGTNYYILGVTGDATAGAFTTAVTLTPLEAKNIDDKVDDGKPSLGIVRARGAGTDAPDTVPVSVIDSSAGTVAGCALWVATSYTTKVRTNTYHIKNTTAQCTLRFKLVL